MPTTYTHNFFGKVVYQKLPEEIQELITRNKMAYLIGQHGPDILFYYRPFCENRINRLGHQMHEESATDFFSRCKAAYRQSGDEVLLVYTIGYICHYMLDSTCNPYIEQYTQRTGAGNDEIESELDRILMEKSGKNPFSHRPADDLRGNRALLKAITVAYEDVTEQQIRKCLKAMRFYTGLTVCRNAFKRKALLGCMRCGRIYKKVQGRVIRKKRLKRCEESTKELLAMLRVMVPETVTVIEEFYQTLSEEEYLNYRFERNYK